MRIGEYLLIKDKKVINRLKEYFNGLLNQVIAG